MKIQLKPISLVSFFVSKENDLNIVKEKCGVKGSLLLALLCSVGVAQASVIFQDNFDTTRTDGSTVTAQTDMLGNGWTEVNYDANDVSIQDWSTDSGFQGAMRLRDQAGSGTVTSPDAAASQLGLSTIGFNTINLSFDWRALDTSNEGSDHFYVSWRASNAGAWTELADFSLGGSVGSFISQSYSLSTAGDNATHLQFQFWTDVTSHTVAGASGNNGQTEGVYVDNVLLTGQRIVTLEQSSSVPEPGTFALLGLGLAGLGFIKRRKA